MTADGGRGADSPVQRAGTPIAVAFDRVFAPLGLFVAIYAAALYVVAPLATSFYWSSLIAAAVATAGAVGLWDRGRWQLGIAAPPRTIVIESAAGLLLAVFVVGLADLLIVGLTGLRHSAGTGFPLEEFFLVFLPAAVHEELLFRGYPFQRLWRWHRGAAVVAMSLLFAMLHAWNNAVTLLALVNIFLGGVLLSLAYALFERLWFPTALHLGWNVMSGPVLGYEVSGYRPEATLLQLSGAGPEILTGGAFGIEGSVVTTAVEIAAIAALLLFIRKSKFFILQYVTGSYERHRDR